VATDFACDPSGIQARAGQRIHLKLQNNGSVAHDLSLSVLAITQGGAW
jgi:hypothetical protein